MRVNLPAVGQSYRHTDLPLSAQVTRNWYPEVNIETSTTVSLQPFFGATLFAFTAYGADRGVGYWGDKVYKVTGTALYSVTSAGVMASIGTISGTGRCDLLPSAAYLVVVTSGYVYIYDGATLTLADDVDLESPETGAFLNNQWIYSGDDGRFCTSDAGLPGTINGLNYAAAESSGDPLIRVFVFNQLVYLFGTATIETWYNSGVGTPPFDRVEGGIVQTGLGAVYSVAANDNLIYFLGDDALVYQMSGSQARSISTIPVAQAFESYDDISDAVGFCYTISGQNFYQLNIGGATWVFNEAAGAWFEATIGTTERQHPATSSVRAFGKVLLCDGGALMELSPTEPLYNGSALIRERVTGVINGETLGAEYIGRPLFMSRCEVIIKGMPPTGVVPEVLLSWSDDAGVVWSPELSIATQQLSPTTFKAITCQLGRFYDRIFKIRIEDKSRCAIHRMTGDIDVGN